ncbi:MAG: prepilin-type N-terminal cleavage/methylation domain-containing protein [Phycisphaeraceae bacterium]|nr:prepilin-type N-terminal cleavage/methylation domain-containing protein [Phycisphaerae bacterium]MBX3393429.1 prepilin-type N-terminal cleavage/methylation domain-containing protein [Phycisphaeraceae bacterium]HRJ48986.1 prepilin-type N-terminal cleavage/methylation domain-containing protein [Phycisphaerales bacterium]
MRHPIKSMPGRLIRFASGGVAALLCLAGIGKLLDAAAAIDDFAAFPVMPMPAWLVPPLVVAVSVMEVIAGAVWFDPRRRLLAELAMIVLLGAFIAVLAVQLTSSNPPRCGCFGLLQRYLAFQADADSAIGRSACMLAVVSLAAWSRMPSRNPQTTSHGVPHSRRAFTLVEVLAVIALVGVLLALLVPALSHARAAAKATITASRLRQNGSIFLIYAGDHRGYWPCPIDPRGEVYQFSVPEIDFVHRSRTYFSISSYYWTLALASSYYGGKAFDPVWCAAEAPIPHRWVFEYPCVYIARPEYWAPTTREGKNQYGGTRVDEVRYPTKKTLLASTWHVYRRSILCHNPVTHISRCDMGPAPIPAVMPDGSFHTTRYSDVLPGYHNGDGERTDGFTHFMDYPPTGHTIHGVHGRDIQ